MRIASGMGFQFFTASANSRSAFLGTGEILQHPVEVAGVVLEYAREHEMHHFHNRLVSGHQRALLLPLLEQNSSLRVALSSLCFT